MTSSKPKALTYPEAIRVFNDDDVMQSLKEACQKLSESGTTLLKTFESISTQLHTFDKQRSLSLTPRWTVYQKDFTEIVRQHKANAAIISGRLKMFCTVILPLTLQSRCYREIAQILQSFMNISSDTMSNTRRLVETQLKLNNDLTSFHTEFAKIAHLKADDQKELGSLDPQFSQLENTIRQIYLVNGQMTEPDVTLLAFSALRMTSATSYKRTKLSHRQLILPGPELSEMNRLYEDLEHTQNAIAHALYNSKISHRETDITTTTRMSISSLVTEESIITEPILTFFVSIWARLQADCLIILRWLQDGREPSCTPCCIKAYVDSGHTLYLSVADALDVYFSQADSNLAKVSVTQKSVER